MGTSMDEEQEKGTHVPETDLSIVDLEENAEMEKDDQEAAQEAQAPPQRSVFDRLYPGSRPRRPLKKTSDSARSQLSKPPRRQRSNNRPMNSSIQVSLVTYFSK